MSDESQVSNELDSAEQESANASENSNYDLEIPEDMKVSPELLEMFNAEAKELNLDNAGAQRLLDISRRNQQRRLEEHNKQMSAWQDEIRKDKNMGGAAFESTVAYAKAGLQKFDPNGELLSILDQSGYGNNPHVVRFLASIGRAHAEDKAILGSPSRTDTPRHERLYGKYNSL